MATPFPFTFGQKLTSAQMNAITTLPINDQTASYTAVLSDVGKRIVMNVATANTVTIDDSIFSVGDTIFIANKAAGITTITAGSGVTINTSGSLALAQHGGGTLVALSASVFTFFSGSGSGSSVPTLVQITTTGATNYTVPAGVTYMIATITGGGGGVAMGASAGGNGGDSSVAFAGGTVTAAGGVQFSTTSSLTNKSATGARWGAGAAVNVTGMSGAQFAAANGATIRAGGATTPGATVVVTVGAGGTAGTNGAAGKQGIVILEYYASNKRRCDLFTAGGTFTPPTGVTTVNAYIRGAGGSSNVDDANTGSGGSSSVAFAGGTVTALGGTARVASRGSGPTFNSGRSAANNSGDGSLSASFGGSNGVEVAEGERGQEQLVTGAVTPGTGITVTVGAGVSYSGTSGSGCVWIDYEVA